MISRKTLLLITSLALGASATASAQQPAGAQQAQSKPAATAPQHTRAGRVSATQQKPAISADSARKIALANTPNAQVKSEKLERRQGRLEYAFKLKEPGKARSHRLYVDATTGEVVTTHQKSTGAAATSHKADSSARHTMYKKP